MVSIANLALALKTSEFSVLQQIQIRLWSLVPFFVETSQAHETKILHIFDVGKKINTTQKGKTNMFNHK